MKNVQAQNVSKNPSRTNYSSIFSSENSESDRVFNYLHDSNSIFWPGELNQRFFRPHSTLSRPPKRGRSVVVSKRNFATLLSTTTQSSNRLRKVPTRSRPTCSQTEISSLSVPNVSVAMKYPSSQVSLAKKPAEVHDTSFQNVMKRDANNRKELYANVVLSGFQEIVEHMTE